MTKQPNYTLVDQTVGHLTVTSFYGKRKGKGYVWKCTCNCGNTRLLNTSAINRAIKTKQNLSCGCIYQAVKNQNLIGIVFDHLTVEALLPKRNWYRQKQWLCMCSCGNKRVCTTSELNAKRAISCGCATSRQGTKYKDIWLSHWSRLANNALARGYEFTVTIQEAWEVFETQQKLCAISKKPILFGKRFTKDETTASLDRIDSTKHYTVDNIQWVHKRVNVMKGNLQDHDFIDWCKLIAQAN